MATTIRTFDGNSVDLHTSDVDRLRRDLRGELLTVGASGYDEARTIWNTGVLP